MTNNIHETAVSILGKRARLEHLRKEAVELAHEIDRYLDGKSNAEAVVGEAHDVAYLARSLAYIEGFEDFWAPTYRHYLDGKSESKLKSALKWAAGDTTQSGIAINELVSYDTDEDE